MTLSVKDNMADMPVKTATLSATSLASHEDRAQSLEQLYVEEERETTKICCFEVSRASVVHRRIEAELRAHARQLRKEKKCLLLGELDLYLVPFHHDKRPLFFPLCFMNELKEREIREKQPL
jgi:hypothetical protein